MERVIDPIVILGSVWYIGKPKEERKRSSVCSFVLIIELMGFLSTVFGFCGFGVGISAGLVIGYFFFIYFQPSDVKVIVVLSMLFCVKM